MKSSEEESNVEMNFQYFLSTSNVANNSKAIAQWTQVQYKIFTKVRS